MSAWVLFTMACLAGAPAPAGERKGEGPWSPFEPIVEREPPAVDDDAWSASPIDRFVLARLRAAGLEPAPPVGRREWLRRATFDLIGLPPTPEEVDALCSDPRPDVEALGAVTDRLLSSPAHGERWARHWLDVVRYADSDGFAIDSERPNLWRYRDYVIRAVQEDMPFDRFIREQIAGDELEAPSPAAQPIVATGFYRLGPYEADNMVAEDSRQDYLDEITSATGAAFLGLTLGCARCHDHKYDPIPTRDYYGLQAFFAPLERTDRSAELAGSERTADFETRRAEAEAELKRRETAYATFRVELKKKLAASLAKDPATVSDADLDGALGKDAPFTSAEKSRNEELKKAPAEWKGAARYGAIACAVSNPANSAAPPKTRVLLGGCLTSPGEEVTPAFLSAVQMKDPAPGQLLASARSAASGRRRALAEWMASASNPLVPRVIVNRVWLHHLGQGIVATPNDFGRNGSGASHPELLDFLAQELIQGGWKLKPLHRAIVLSRTYRTSARHPDPASCEKVDPQNRWLWRGSYRRLEAEVVRDAMLAVSGRLSQVRGGPGFYEELPSSLGRSFPFFNWDASSEEDRRRRSIYIFQRRNLVIPMLEAFDCADMSEPCERRRSSVTTPQVLTLFNGKLANDAARHMAWRVLTEAPLDPAGQVDRVFRLAFGRHPEPFEAEASLRLVREQTGLHREAMKETEGKAGLLWVEVAALADLCLVVLNSNELLYLE